MFFLGVTLHLEWVIEMLEALLAGSQICQIDALLFVGVDVTDHVVDGLSDKNTDSSLARMVRSPSVTVAFFCPSTIAS